MCKGIAVLVYEKKGKLKGLCTGITSHDELCREDEELRLGKIEPYRFELLYPANLTYDRGSRELEHGNGMFGELPPQVVWDVAFEVSKEFFMKHTKKQLQKADMRGADMREAGLEGANLEGADLDDGVG